LSAYARWRTWQRSCITRRAEMLVAQSTSAYNLFCCTMGASTPASDPGRGSMHARYRASLLRIQFIISFCASTGKEDAETRLERLTQKVTELVSSWSMRPVIEAYQATRRGVSNGGHLCGGNRGHTPFRDTAAIHGLSGSRSFRALHRRNGPTRQHYQGRKSNGNAVTNPRVRVC
jgi:hypothetical protein